MCSDSPLVPLAGIEPALLAESDFESDASTNSATGARAGRLAAALPDGRAYSGARAKVNMRQPRGADLTLPQ